MPVSTINRSIPSETRQILDGKKGGRAKNAWSIGRRLSLPDREFVYKVCTLLSIRDSMRHGETTSPGGGGIFALLKLSDISGSRHSVGRQLVYHAYASAVRAGS